MASSSNATAVSSVTVTFDPLPTPPLEVGIAFVIAGLIAVPTGSVLLSRRFKQDPGDSDKRPPVENPPNPPHPR